MVARYGDRLVYDNIGMGCAKHPEDDEQVFLTFTDHDNQEMHMVPVAIGQLEQYFELIRQQVAGQKIHIAAANEMPKEGPQRGA